MKQIKVKLSVNGLEELKQKLLALQSGLNEASIKIAKELADVCEKEVASNYASSPYTDGNDESVPFKEETENGYKVGAKGSQVAYREFGTGTEGLNKPHPIKNKFNLKGYNTGKTIRPATLKTSANTGVLLGELYWTYKNKSGELVYTQRYSCWQRSV